ncbi:MAG: hypothetical protein GX856_14380 [Gammaproteobacteria bacterium]|jgi:hypothetical protein|nr:hypothetical protein [Gammaproteobacteria bacterium]
MAIFFCHVFGVAKQVRLERIVRPAALMLPEEETIMLEESVDAFWVEVALSLIHGLSATVAVDKLCLAKCNQKILLSRLALSSL